MSKIDFTADYDRSLYVTRDDLIDSSKRPRSFVFQALKDSRIESLGAIKTGKRGQPRLVFDKASAERILNAAIIKADALASAKAITKAAKAKTVQDTMPVVSEINQDDQESESVDDQNVGVA